MPKKKFHARIEVYFIIYVSTIVSFFAIEGEVRQYKRNQKKILFEVSKEKIENLVQIEKTRNIWSKDSLRLEVDLGGAYQKNSFSGTVKLYPTDSLEGKPLPVLSYPLQPASPDLEDKTFFAAIPRKDFGENREVPYLVEANIKVKPDPGLVKEELEKAYKDHRIVKKIMDAMSSVGEIVQSKRFQNPIDPSGGTIAAPFTLTVDRPVVNIVEGLPWEVRVIVGGVAEPTDLQIRPVQGGKYIKRLEVNTPVTLVGGRGIKNAHIRLEGLRKTDDEKAYVEFDLQVRAPLWVQPPKEKEAYVGDPYTFEGALRDIPSSDTKIRVTGTAVEPQTVPGTTVFFETLKKPGVINFQVLVDNREVKGMTHTVKVIPPPPPKISTNPISRDGNFLVFEITIYGKNNELLKFRRKGGIASQRQKGEPQILGSKKIYRWEVEIEEPYDKSESQEIKFAVMDKLKHITQYRKRFIYNYANR